MSHVWSPTLFVPEADHNKEWDVPTLKKLGGNDDVASVWEALKEKSQARHHKRPAVDDAFPTSCKKPRLKHASSTKVKGTQVDIVPIIVSDQNELFPKLGTTPVGSNT